MIGNGDLWLEYRPNCTPIPEVRSEAHNKYIDIQIPLSAEEMFGVKARSVCTFPVGTFDDENGYIHSDL